VISSAKPAFDDAPDDLRFFSESIDGRRDLFFHVKNFQDLVRLDPRIAVKNIGDEPVEAMRVEVRFVKGQILLFKGKDNPSLEINHRVLKQNATDDYVLSGKLMKGDEAAVSTIRGLAEQILDSQDPGHLDKPQKALFEITCYGRLVGGTGFDEAEPQKGIYMWLAWEPPGFPPEETRKRIGEIKRNPIINRTR
jgi:hypothetical protein